MKHIRKFEYFSLNDDKLDESVKSNIAAALMLIGTLTTQNTHGMHPLLRFHHHHKKQGHGYPKTNQEIQDTKAILINDIDKIDPTDPFLIDIKNKISSNWNEYVYTNIIQDLISYCDKNNMSELSNILKELNIINKSTKYFQNPGSDIPLDKINQKEKLYNILKDIQKIRDLEHTKSNSTTPSTQSGDLSVILLLIITLIGLSIFEKLETR